MPNHLKQVHHYAEEHEKAHERLKKMVSGQNVIKEKVFPIFIATFVIALLSILIFRNWGNIIELVKKGPSKPAVTIETDGIKTGVKSVYAIDKQANFDYRTLLSSVLTLGSIKAVEANVDFGAERGVKQADIGELLKDSVWLTNYLSTGQHLTKMQQSRAKALTKSILSTYYLGEKTVDIDSALQTDAQILSKIKNTLSVDLFQYLDQASNRSDALDEYQNLLKVLINKTDQRITDLNSKIAFLESNYKARTTEIKTSESEFFKSLQIFDGPDAEDELKKFIGLREDEVEIKAKLGAYKSLRGYYKFFKPKLDTMAKAVSTNRSALIAGVKVVEVQNMTLPLIIKEK